jgi:hypothetical protein
MRGFDSRLDDKTYGVAWFLVLLAGGYAIYHVGIGIKYFADDFGYLQPCPNPLYFFAHRNVYAPFYRPFDAALACSVQGYFGLETWPISLVHIFFHALLSWLVFWGAREAGVSRLGATIGSLLMLISQANASAVLRNDTFSQLGSSFFGFLGLILLYVDLSRVRTADMPWRPFFGLSALSLSASLFFKETGMGYFVAMSFLLLTWVLLRREPALSRRSVAIRIAGLAAGCATYLIIRSSVLTWEIPPGGRYSLGSVAAWLRNLGLIFFSSSLPVSSVDFYTWWQQRYWPFLAGALILTALFLIVVACGILHEKNPRELLGLSAVGLFATIFPVYLFQHVSELYTYNWMPVFSVIVGCGLGNVFGGNAALRRKVLLAGFGLLLLVSHGLAIQAKALSMRENGMAAQELLKQMRPWLTCVHRGGRVILLNSPPPRPQYSVFIMHGFNVLQGSLGGLHYIAGRRDFDFVIADQADHVQGGRCGDLVLTLGKDGRVVPVSLPSPCPGNRSGERTARPSF